MYRACEQQEIHSKLWSKNLDIRHHVKDLSPVHTVVTLTVRSWLGTVFFASVCFRFSPYRTLTSSLVDPPIKISNLLKTQNTLVTYKDPVRTAQ